MKFLVDAQLPSGLCRWLEVRGHEAVHVTEVLAGDAPDTEIAARAEADGAVLVSKDDDFRILQLGRDFRLIWLRCGNTTNRALNVWLEVRWP